MTSLREAMAASNRASARSTGDTRSTTALPPSARARGTDVPSPCEGSVMEVATPRHSTASGARIGGTGGFPRWLM
jgi:hypothetical protein